MCLSFFSGTRSVSNNINIFSIISAIVYQFNEVLGFDNFQYSFHSGIKMGLFLGGAEVIEKDWSQPAFQLWVILSNIYQTICCNQYEPSLPQFLKFLQKSGWKKNYCNKMKNQLNTSTNMLNNIINHFCWHMSYNVMLL